MSACRPVAVRLHCRLAVAVAACFLALCGPAKFRSVWADAGPDRSRLSPERAPDLEKDVTQGALRMIDKQGGVVECPLKHTDVQAEVAGFIARVKVTQTFVNPTNEKIEAVYVFPLPHEAAVDQMTMLIGERRIVGLIKRRLEARQIYEQALRAGQTAALLEQERPNIFTQSVGNIPPGQEVRIEIGYIDVLRYDVGTYEFHFPMVVGPRYNPGAPIASPTPNPPELQGKVSPPTPDTTRVSDASRISPPVLKPGFRNGHDVSVSVKLDAGVPIQNLTVTNHRADVDRPSNHQAAVTLAKNDTLPNKDFVLRYDVTGTKPAMAVLPHTGRHGSDAQRLGEGYFLLMIQPQEDERLTKSPPREIVFLVDVSGSMSGAPTQKVIDAMQHMLKLCRAQDTVQVITFASHSQKLFERPVPVNEESVQRALNFTQGLRGGGGTEMLKGVKLAIDEPLDPQRLRIVVMLTDGYIGNEAEIIEHVGKHCGDQVRFWAIGIGQAPNMFLIDGVAKQGGGMGKKLGLNDDAGPLTQEVMTRIQRAQLAKLKIDWGTHQVVETFPARLPELWAGRPVIVYGRYRNGSSGRITVSGQVEGQNVSWPLDVQLPAAQPHHDVLAKVWARQKIESLMQSCYYQGSPAVEEEVTALALDYQLMSQYTSFVAVDAVEAGQQPPAAQPPRRMLVPVPLPEGTRWEGFFGGDLTPTEEAESLGQLSLRRNVARDSLRELKESAGKRLARKSAASGMYHSALAGPAPTAPARATFSYGTPGAATSPAPALAGLGGGGPLPSGAVAGRLETRGRKRQGTLADRIPAAQKQQLQRADRGKFGLALKVTADAADFEDRYVVPGQALSALISDAPTLQKAAREALQRGSQLLKDSKLDEARPALLQAYLLDTSLARAGHSDGSTATAALEALEENHRQQTVAWTKTLPGLDKRLDLILRDQSLADAVAAVAKAAALPVKFLPGSVADVTTLLDGEEPRVTFLDLRGATAAQALDWLLRPARLSWWVADGGVIAGSDRRTGTESAWVYDVSALAWPSAAELKKADDAAKRTAIVRSACTQFLAIVRSHLKIADATALAWFGPGQLLVTGSPQTHEAAAKLFANLGDATFQPPAELAQLHAATSQRAKDGQIDTARRRAARRQAQTAAAHAEYGWRLLAAAADGRLDLEALTELQLAWKSSEPLLAGEDTILALRSVWQISEAARTLPQEAELQTLAAIAQQQARGGLDAALALLVTKPDDVDAYFRVLYGTLALANDSRWRAKAEPLLTHPTAADAPLGSVRLLAAALLQPPAKIDRPALQTLITEPAACEDLVVLTALACRRAGGDVWQTFRAESQDLLAQIPLPGSVVVLISRLANAPLPLLAAR